MLDRVARLVGAIVTDCERCCHWHLLFRFESSLGLGEWERWDALPWAGLGWTED